MITYQNNSTNINGMQISWVSTTSVKVSAGNCYDSGNALFIEFADDVVINAATVGANGLDVGALQANKWYYVHVFYDQSAFIGPSAVLSLSAVAPSPPKGFSASRMIGRAVLTDGSSHILPFYRRGTLNLRQHYWDQAIRVLTDGSATTNTVFSCNAAIPPVETSAYLDIEMVPDVAADQIEISIPGSTTSYGARLTASVSGRSQKSFTGQVPVSLVSNVASLQYNVTSSDDVANIYVNGYDDPLL